MKPYPKRLYLSASWKGDHRASTAHIAGLMAGHDVTVVRDHEKNKMDPLKSKRTWAQRVDLMLRDCSGLVAVLPHDARAAQTTSPYLIPELLAADAQGIPILLFTNPGVTITKTVANDELEIRFPNSGTGRMLRAVDVFSLSPDQTSLLETLLDGAGGFVLSSPGNVNGPLTYPNHSNHRATENAIEDFIKECGVRNPYSFVFNVLPFALQDTAHQVIASAVFKATGMACHISLDSITGETSVRRNWEMMLQRTDLVIAELSSLRDTCLFETGCAVGLGKSVFIVSKNGQDVLPFGLDDQAFYKYTSPEDLARHVSETCCRAHLREVFNLSKDFVALHADKPVPPGVPSWIDQKVGFGLDGRLTLSIWAVVLSAAVAVQIAVIWIWPSFSRPNALALCSAASGFLAVTRVGREFWEKKIGKWLSWLPWVGLCVLALLVAGLIFAMTTLEDSPKAELAPVSHGVK